MDRSEWTVVIADSLEKVFPDEAPRAMDRSIAITAFAGETVSFQLAVLPPTVDSVDSAGLLRFSTEADAAATVRLSSVELVPCTVVALEGHDSGYLRDKAGLYPDLLRPLEDGAPLTPYLGQWRSVWVDVVAPGGFDGTIEVTVTVRSDRADEPICRVTVPIEVTAATLPELDIVNTQWIHCDSLANYYGVEVFSEDHWTAIERTIRKAADMGVNSVLTPAWTPPLDTAVGGTRRPVQLIDIDDDHGVYRFDFSRLERWMELCRRHGMRLLEMPHLFTQWGAEFAPAIYVRVDGEIEHRFGWHTPATDLEYRRLLGALLPELRALLDTEWGLDRVIFHISDEPHGPAMRETYTAARDVVRNLLEGCTVVDALSDFDFYSTGLVEHPVVATDAVEPFVEAGLRGLWVYYCVGQTVDVANRFIGQPSTRNRVLGTQLFLLGAGGFLHWGFDFYNTAGSTASVDPFRDTCAGDRFLAGDAFIVYPGPDFEPWESIRFRVFAEAMADHRAMQLLRDLTDQETARALVEAEGEITMKRYSSDPDRYRRTRAALTKAIVRASPSTAPK